MARLHTQMICLTDSMYQTQQQMLMLVGEGLLCPWWPYNSPTWSDCSLHICSLISIDGSEPGGPEVSEREATATQRTMDTIRACNVAQIFADCAFLRPDSLLALARAVVWAAAGGGGADGDTDTAEVRTGPTQARLLTVC